MANKISLSTVKSCAKVIGNHGNKIERYFNHIQTDYLDGTQAEWNTPSAKQYVTGVSGSLNDFINQFNTKFKEGFKSFIDGVNQLSASQNAEKLQEIELAHISNTEVSWQEQSTDFNVPQDYASFTDSHLVKGGIDQIKQEINSIKNAINTAQEQGLDNAFCSQIRDALGKLSDSANEVIESYGKDAAKAAVDEDQLLSQMRSNT